MKNIKLTNGGVFGVDDCDHPLVSQFKWRSGGVKDKIYPVRWMNNKKHILQKVSQFIMKAPRGLVVDHINGDTLDNRRSNLRICTKQQNGWNRGKTLRVTTSKYKGVHFDRRTKKWRAMIKYNNRKMHIGSFKNERDAARGYDHKAAELFGKYAKTNKVMGIL